MVLADKSILAVEQQTRSQIRPRPRTNIKLPSVCRPPSGIEIYIDKNYFSTFVLLLDFLNELRLFIGEKPIFRV
jgi:hypothetical protein